MILCYSAANYFLDFAGETLLVREHVVQNSSLAEKPKIKIFASSLGDVGSLMNPNYVELPGVCPMPWGPSGRCEKSSQMVPDPALQKGN